MSIPVWKMHKCEMCGAGPGAPCGKRPLGVPWGWQTVKPHAARVRAAAKATAPAPGEVKP